MEPDVSAKLLAALEEQGRKIDDIALSVRRVRQYLFWTAVATAAFFLLPLVGLLFALPSFIRTMTAGLSGL